MTTSEPQPEKLWSPSPERIQTARITAFTKWLARTRGLKFQHYELLWEWSVTDLEGFWAAVWEYFEIQATRPYERVLAEEAMPFTRWFEGAELNFVTQVFYGREGGAAAIRFESEALGTGTVSWAELESQVAALAATLRALGVRPGDRVAAILPNVPHSVIAFLAVASIGAVWSVCAPDMGPLSITDRLRQIEPVVLIACDGYRFGGKDYDRRDVVAQVLAALPTVRCLIVVPLVGRADARPVRDAQHTVSWAQALVGREALRLESVPFAHPLWILYSSGTTGLPKAIVHGHGGILLNGLVAITLHANLAPGDLLLWLSSTAWVVWNAQVMALSAGVTVFQFDGAVTGPTPAPDWGHVWDVVGRNGVTAFGTGAAFFAACLKAGVRPRERADLSALQSISSTGSPLSPACYRWIYADVKQDVWVANISGGTDFAGAFLSGNPTLPVYIGEMQCRSLGAAVLAFDDRGRSTMNEVGELVCTRPMPSMPIGFWNDLDGKRYLESYFETFVGERGERIWRHGDWLRLTERPESVTSVIYGRSDSTVNRQGVRMGTAEFYRVVEAFPDIADSLVIDLEYLGREPHLILFIVIRNAADPTPELDRRIRSALREALSPRHVPNEIVPVPSVPRTLTGKKLEVPVRRLLLGHPVEKIVSRDSLANPESLDWYMEFSKAFLARHPSGPHPP